MLDERTQSRLRDVLPARQRRNLVSCIAVSGSLAAIGLSLALGWVWRDLDGKNLGAVRTLDRIEILAGHCRGEPPETIRQEIESHMGRQRGQMTQSQTIRAIHVALDRIMVRGCNPFADAARRSS